MCLSCRSRQELSNEYLLEKIGVDTAGLPASQPAENEPSKVSNFIPTQAILNVISKSHLKVRAAVLALLASMDSRAPLQPAAQKPGRPRPAQGQGEDEDSKPVLRFVERFDIEPYSDFSANDQTL